MKTDEQVNEQLAKLLEVKPNVRPRSMFGDDNLAALDATELVLKERMGWDAVEARFGEGAFLDESEWDEHVYAAAVCTSDWLFGRLANDEDAPAEGWSLKG